MILAYVLNGWTVIPFVLATGLSVGLAVALSESDVDEPRPPCDACAGGVFPDHTVTVVVGYDDDGRPIDAAVPCPFHYDDTPAHRRALCPLNEGSRG